MRSTGETWAATYTKGVTLLKESTRRDSSTCRAFTLLPETLLRTQKVHGTPKHMPNDVICFKGAPLLTKGWVNLNTTLLHVPKP